MIVDLARRAAARAWWAEWRIRRAGGRSSCYGRVQLALGPGARVAGDGRSLVGVRSFGASSVRSAVTVLAVGRGGLLGLGEGAVVGRGCVLSVGSGARLEVGRGSYVADGSRLAASASIVVGERCAISWGVTVIDDDGHGFGPPPYSAPVAIGDDVWVGCNATILKGVSIGAGSAVGAGAVVTRSCPPRSLVAGVPARVVRSDISWTDAGRR